MKNIVTLLAIAGLLHGELPLVSAAAFTPTVIGAIQLPHGGAPIVIGADGPITGGYPIIAVIARHALDTFHALPLGGAVTFVRS